MLPFPSDEAVLTALRALGAHDAEGWAPHIAAACRRYGVDTDRRLALFLAQAHHETGGFKRLVESLNYSVDGLLRTFGRHRISEAEARAFGRKPGEKPLSEERQAKIANALYGGSWGARNLGNTQPNDGAFFRGRGIYQTTGRANYAKLAKALGKPITELPAWLETKEGAAESAAFFWASRPLNACADCGDIAEGRRLVNGGQLGLAEVEHLNGKALTALSALA